MPLIVSTPSSSELNLYCHRKSDLEVSSAWRSNKWRKQARKLSKRAGANQIGQSSLNLEQRKNKLQKLSKCEVKAWLCWNLTILLALRLYVKSNFGEIKWSKNVIFGNFRDSELWILVKLALGKCFILLKTTIQNL